MDNPNIELRETKDRGRGIFACAPIKKDEVIAEFDGAMYDYDYEDWNDDLADHVIQFERRKWRDSMGIAKYLNHSCDPNCGIKELFIIVAMRDISPGEELVWDYDMSEDNYHWDMDCHCGSPLCRGTIGAFRRLSQSIREKYRGYISDWLVKEYKLQ
jgi:hypothetical protein